MKTLRGFLAFTALSCSMLATSTSTQLKGDQRDLIDTAMDVHKFDTFLMLVRDADLTFNLKGSGPYTIFMPTDEAFSKLPSGWLEKIHGNHPRLRQFLLHHVVRGSWTAEAAVRAKSLKALDGSKLMLRNVDGHGMIGASNFAVANVRCSNGMLQGIDAVLMGR